MLNEREKICINDIRRFIKAQTGKNLSRVPWNSLIKSLNLHSIKIDKNLSPCLFIARYKKLKNFRVDLRSRLAFCSKETLCLEGIYTWSEFDHK